MHHLRLIFPLLLALAAGATQAATPAHQRQPNPLDPSTPVAPLAYDSAFAGYKAYQEPQAADWKQANAALVEPAGQDGHAGHDASAMKDGGVTPAPAAADPHAGHDMAKMKEAAKPAAATRPAAAAQKPDPHAGHPHH